MNSTVWLSRASVSVLLLSLLPSFLLTCLALGWTFLHRVQMFFFLCFARLSVMLAECRRNTVISLAVCGGGGGSSCVLSTSPVAMHGYRSCYLSFFLPRWRMSPRDRGLCLCWKTWRRTRCSFLLLLDLSSLDMDDMTGWCVCVFFLPISNSKTPLHEHLVVFFFVVVVAGVREQTTSRGEEERDVCDAMATLLVEHLHTFFFRSLIASFFSFFSLFSFRCSQSFPTSFLSLSSRLPCVRSCTFVLFLFLFLLFLLHQVPPS